jgi:hypothetical protein
MQTEQARAILAAHDAHDAALRNLRNAASMSADDSRSTEMLESAGDEYARTLAALRNVNLEAAPVLLPGGSLITHGRGELGPLSSPAKAASAENPSDTAA